jgi:predicted DNA-binding WGR domain protein
MQRRLQYIGGSSAKFYEVATDGKSVITRFGRLGTAGQIQKKSFSNEQAAASHAAKLIQSKLAKGYVEATHGGSS